METPSDLITMADVARLAGQQRSTVGNWKSRDASFPPERGKGSRGPLYDRAEVIDWLTTSGRLAQEAPSFAEARNLTQSLGRTLSTEDAVLLLLLVFAMRAKKSDVAWDLFCQGDPNEFKPALHRFANEELRPAYSLIRHAIEQAPDITELVIGGSDWQKSRLSGMADQLVNMVVDHPRAGQLQGQQTIAQLVLGLCGRPASIYNPASGLGGFLITAGALKPAPKIFGQEINQWAYAVSLLRMRISGVDGDVERGDVFFEDRFAGLKTDAVVSSPPLNMRFENTEALANDPRWIWGSPGPNGGNMAWIQHCLSHVNDAGRAVVVMPAAVQFESGISARIRQGIIRAGLLDAVIALPPGMLRFTAVPLVVLVFRKGRPTVGEMPSPTLMVNLEDVDETEGHKATLTASLIEKTLEIYKSWSAGTVPDSAIAKVVSYSEIAANDFVISPRRFVQATYEAVSIEDLASRLTAARDALGLALEQSQRCDLELTDLLKGQS